MPETRQRRAWSSAVRGRRQTGLGCLTAHMARQTGMNPLSLSEPGLIYPEQAALKGEAKRVDHWLLENLRAQMPV